MESKKLSSIEWLIEELGEYFPIGVGGIELMVEKAKEKHKQEIIDACEEFGNLNGVDIEDYTEYYNQTFNQQ
jgi:hypothetical protein